MKKSDAKPTRNFSVSFERRTRVRTFLTHRKTEAICTFDSVSKLAAGYYVIIAGFVGLIVRAKEKGDQALVLSLAFFGIIFSIAFMLLFISFVKDRLKQLGLPEEDFFKHMWVHDDPLMITLTWLFMAGFFASFTCVLIYLFSGGPHPKAASAVSNPVQTQSCCSCRSIDPKSK